MENLGIEIKKLLNIEYICILSLELQIWYDSAR